MRSVLEKYVALPIEFANKAGEMRRILEAQKRLVTKMARNQKSEDVKKLITIVAEGYDVGIDLLEYNKQLLQGVANDAEVLLEGAKTRDIIKDQSEMINFFLNDPKRTNTKTA